MELVEISTPDGTLRVPAFLVRRLEIEVGRDCFERLRESPADLAMALSAMRAMLRHRWLLAEGLQPG